jgi:hypothetical protein
MQEQNFEKQVKQKMEELSVAPSAPVWMKVEEQIRQKRSRRRIFFWLFPMGFLLAGFITWSLIRYNENSFARQKNLQQEYQTAVTKILTQKKAEAAEKQSLRVQENSTDHDKNFEKVTTVNSSNLTNQTIQYSRVKISNKDLVSVSKRKPVSDNQNTYSPITKKEDQNTTKTNEQETAIVDKKTREDEVAPDTARSSPDAVTAEIKEMAEIKPEQPHTEENKAAEVSGTTTENKWRVSPYFSIGVSSLQFINGSANKRADQFTSTPGIGSGLPPQTPSEPENGLSISLGMKFNKAINKRLDVYTGLGYYYASAHRRVGQPVDADSMFRNNYTSPVAVDQYYRAGNTENYTNRYHFVEIPVGINWKVNKKIPLQLETGISLSQLIASNALTYDAGSGNYYRNNKLLYKTHFAFGGSLTYRLFSVKQKSFYAGPYFKYHLTQMEKSNSKQYLFSVGLGLNLKF